MSFINTGADEALLKSLYGDSVHVDQDELCKAMNRAGLVQKEVQVRGKNGQTFTRKQWVRASDAQSTQSSSSSQKKTDTDDNEKPVISAKEQKALDSLRKLSGWEDDGLGTGTDDNDVFYALNHEPEDNGKLFLKTTYSAMVDGDTSKDENNDDNWMTAQEVLSEVSNKENKELVSKEVHSNTWKKVGSSQEAKQQIASVLASGKSREDCMAEFKKLGVTWKENDHAGINWMRASMAMNKYLTSGAETISDDSKTKKR